MGVVYEAYDHEQGAVRALKTLRNLRPEDIYLFKNEFRSLADLHHPNLIQLYELFCEDGLWFFSMERLSGQDLLSFVRGPAPAALELLPRGQTLAEGEDAPPSDQAAPEAPEARPFMDEARLRAALGQLSLGIVALHRAGKIHRDIKPSNVLVTDEGRVVLLDFGLITDASFCAPSQVVGTPAYMAPEQAVRGALSPASDWYSVGVMLYQALTGQLPFQGEGGRVMAAKQQHEPAPPKWLSPEIPEDLDALCRALLRRSPQDRPPAAEILSALGVPGGRYAGPAPSSFVGRAAELSSLREAFSESQRGRAVLLSVRGESGIGKSALCRRFLDALAEEPGVVALAGRCYERESVPYKALDGVIDALAEHLLSRDAELLAEILPADGALLAQLFPALLRLPGLEGARGEPQRTRSRAFSALKELLRGLARRRGLVLFIDDFQWADPDSLALLSEVFEPPAPPLFLLVTERASTREALSRVTKEARRLPLSGLSPDESRALLAGLWAEGEARGPGDRAGEGALDLIGEAGGHPLFLKELWQHSRSAHGQAAKTRLDDALFARVERLGEAGRRVIEVAAVAGAPIAQREMAEAAGLSVGDFMAEVSSLRAQQLLRTAGARGSDLIEPYHDRVRESVLARLAPRIRKDHHRRLAAALERAGVAERDPQALVSHLEGAGEGERAAAYAVKAAELSARALAFDRAAELYRAALRSGRYDASETERLSHELGEALAAAGRGPEAAEAFLAAARGASAPARLDRQRRAAEHLLGSGHLARGVAVLSEVLSSVGERAPDSALGALRKIFWNRLQIRLRGKPGFIERRGEAPQKELMAIDVCHGVAVGLGSVDAFRVIAFQSRALLLALKAGDRRRVGRALIVDAIMTAIEGSRQLPRALALLAEAEALIQGDEDPDLLGSLATARGVMDIGRGRYRAATRALAEREDSSQSPTSYWEKNSARAFRLYALRQMGLFSELAPLFEEFLKDARRRDDRMIQSRLLGAMNVVFLVKDDPSQAEQALQGKPWTPSPGAYHAHHWDELWARGEIALYQEEPGAYERLRPKFRELSRSFFLYVESVRCEALWLRGRLSLADAEAERGALRRGRLLLAAANAARGLSKERAPYAGVWGGLLAAALFARSGLRSRAAEALRGLIPLAEERELFLCAAVARYRLGELIGGEEGRALLSLSEGWMRGENIARPDRLARVLAPGFRASSRAWL
jgi:eukaryotic-like serine/threonine-protein kinase